MLSSIDINGYRALADFHAQLGELTVVIGANGSGKSSLFDFLRFVSFAASNPLPPEIDPRSSGRTIFHVGRSEKIEFGLTVDLGQGPVRYEVEIAGPVGARRVTRESLATLKPLGPEHGQPFIFLSFQGRTGVVQDPSSRKLKRPEWTVMPNELALRRALDPTLVTLSRFQGYLSSWRFYSGFDVSSGAAIRRPAPTEPEPTLAEDGSNLSAVLFWLMTEHPESWQELEVHLTTAVPGFESIKVKPSGGPGTVIGVWNEVDAKGLTLADLSDGTLRLLCWAVLCLSPKSPPLICIDEPELGLHPRVLPIVAGLLQTAAVRVQIVVATHSPYLLSQFSLEVVAAMRKEGGRSLFRRPVDSHALKREVEEIGAAALEQMHISDELETLS